MNRPDAPATASPILAPEILSELERLDRDATAGPWQRCHHLQSAAKDASCPCGYRGSVWSGDGEAVVLEMGVTPSEHPDLDPPSCKRPVQLADAALVVALRNHAAELIEAARERDRLLPFVEHVRNALFVPPPWPGGPPLVEMLTVHFDEAMSERQEFKSDASGAWQDIAKLTEERDRLRAENEELRGLLVFDRDAFSALQFAFPPSDSRRAELRERARYIDAALQEPTDAE